MRSAAFVAGALTLLFALPVAAEDFTIHADLFGQKKAAPRPPAVDWSRGPAADPNAAQKPSVVCGMTLIPADPRVDPKIRVAPSDNVAYTMRIVEPRICKP